MTELAPRPTNRSLVRRFGAGLARDRSGAVALIFGLMLMPLLGAIGLAIDFGQVMTARTKGQMAADAAALQAAGVARDLIKNSDGSASSTAAAISDAQKRAKALFDAHAVQSGLKDYTVTVKVTRTGQSITSSADFRVNSANYIARIFGHNAFSAGGNATSSSSLPNFVDVYVLMDVSQSMGLAATPDDAYKLSKLTNPSCTFGCHVIMSGQGSALPFEQIAANNGVKLRIDVLRSAVIDMINTAQTDASGDSVYRFGLYTMSLNAAKNASALNTISGISGNYATLTAAAQAIDLSGNNDASGIGDSYVNEQITALDAIVPNSGDGSSQSKAQVYTFFVTDGVRDVKGGSCTYGHCVSQIDPTVCAPYKTSAAGVTVGVLYTTYLPIYNDYFNPSSGYRPEYENLVLPIANKIAPALQSCASPGWYFEASDAKGIASAFAKMFAQTSSAPALTN